ncbi:peptidyl-prolyl cis-trans isomerase G-like [Palaemon carinicauda]|uniref:peptidyl-prolyl cis-trans isomerase G-like n=1 Tax=Palaemon carinicauda TaxID=392227 RepID=UPI0035B69CD7
MFGSSSEDDFPKRGWSQTSRPLKREFDQHPSRTSQAGCSHWKNGKESNPERFSSEGSSPSKHPARTLENSPAVEQLSELGMTSFHAPSPPSDWISPAVRSKRSVSGGEDEIAISISQDSNFKMLQEMQQKLSSFMKGYQNMESSSLNTKWRKAESRGTLVDQVSERVVRAATRRDEREIKRSTREVDRSGFQEVKRTPNRGAVHALSSDSDHPAESVFKRSARRDVERALERPPIKRSTERERPPRYDLERDVRRPPIECSTECKRPLGRDVELDVKRSHIARSSERKCPSIERSPEREHPPERDARRPPIERSSELKHPPIERSAEHVRPPGRDVERSSGCERALVCNIERPLVCDVEQQTSRQDIDHNTMLLNSDRADRERSEERQDFLSEEEADVPLSPSEPFEELSKDTYIHIPRHFPQFWGVADINK